MDKRKRLEAGTVLPFSGMECEIDSVVGCGANAMVYRGHYRDLQKQELFHQVLIKELFPYEPDGKIYRNETGRICVQPDAKTQMELHRKSFARGNEVHLRVLMQHPGELDFNINTFQLNDTLYTVLGFSGGRSLEQELEKRKEQSLTELIGRIKKALEALEAFHDLGYLHLDISADNILLIGEGKKERVTLIDYNSVHTVQEIREGAGVYYSEKEGYTAPEVRAGRNREIGFASDLYAMTAVFYTGLTGKHLSVVQSLQTSVPEFADTGCLRDCPSTVLEMVRAILKKGLQPTARRRYQSAAGILRDFEELSDRIEGKGITHWALWETGRERVRRTIRSNTAFHYICREEKLYPLRAATEAGEEVSLLDPAVFCKTDHTPVVLMGSGGMGKTTALLRMAYYQKKTYSPLEPAITYLSLFDWKDGGDTYIQNRILENLRFKPHTDSMETARHELHRLLSAPICTKQGTRPVLILLLDGLNEASGDISPLQKEISELASKDGVRILITSRSEPEGFSCQKIMLEQLKWEEVKKALEEHGILPPQNMELQELLHIPMLLSMYISTALAEKKQLQIDTKEELLEQYFAAMLEKEIRGLPENARESWGIQAAIQYVLPEIAAQIQKLGRAISDPELLKLTENCYKELKKRALTAVFPEWIGHTADIKMGAESADAWYGKIILELLWKRLGLIVRDDYGNFKILHQMMEEYLAEQSRSFHVQFDLEKKKLRDRRRLLSGAGVMAAAMLFGFYNYYMNSVLKKQKEEAQRNESVSLAYSSEEKLKEGDRMEALTLALQALPDKENDRPYVANAENALTDALYVYEGESYQAVHKLKMSTANWKYVVTEDGSRMAGLDENGYVRCYDVQSENLLWSYSSAAVKEESQSLLEVNPYREDRVSGMYLVPSENAVLLADKKEEVVLLSLEDGKEIWSRSYSELDEEMVGDIQQINLSEDGKILALGYKIGKSNTCRNEDFDKEAEFKKVAFLDVSTGELLSRTETLPVSFSIYCDFTENGVFTENNQAYGTLLYHARSKKYHLITINPQTGEVMETAWIDRADVMSHQEGILSKLYYLPPDEKNAGGFLVYVYGYSYNISTGYTGICEMAYLEEEASGWNYHRTYSFDLQDREVPELITHGDWNIFIHKNQIIKTNRVSGEEIEAGKMLEEDIIYYFSDDEKLYLILADGKEYSLKFSSVKEPSQEDVFACSMRVQDGVGGHGSRERFGLVPETDGSSVIFYEWIQSDEDQIRILSTDEKWDDSLNGRVFVLSEKEFLYLEDLGQEDGSYENHGMVYNQQGELTDQFSFSTDVTFVTDALQVSEDGNFLVSDRYVYDRGQGQLISLEELLPESAFVSDLRTAVTKSGIRSLCLVENQPWIWRKGNEYSSGTPYEKEIELSKINSRDTKNHTAKDFESILMGKNGMVVLCCSDGEETEISQIAGTAADYYLVYFMEEDKWVRIENEAGGKAFPVIAVGNESPVFAACDYDKKIRIYDGEKGTLIHEYETNRNVESIREMKFILGDRYLAVLTKESTNAYQIIRLEDGQVVYQLATEDDWSYANLTVQEDIAHNRIYLFDNEHNTDAVSIDTSFWVELDRVKGLRGVLGGDSLIVQNGFRELQLQQRYDLSSLVEMAENVLTG